MAADYQYTPDEQARLEPFVRSLRELRQVAGLTIPEVATATGYGPGLVRAVLLGRRRTSRRAVQAVAAALGGDPGEWGERWQALGLSRERVSTGRCAVAGCPNKPRGRLCWTHHRHNRLYGDPTAGRFSPKTHSEVCSVEGCERPYRARGLCKLHYGHHLAATQALPA